MFLKKFLLFGLIAAVLPAFAEEVADRKTATSLKYVEHELDTRQDKFTAEQNKAMEYTNTAGDVQKRTVKSDLGTNTTDTSLPMVGGVNTKLATKQDDIAAINDHTAVTYTGTSGKIGAKGIYQDTGTYIEQSNNLIDAKTFNAALKRGLDSEFLCSEYKPGTDLCWVWSIHNTEPVSINLFDMSQIPTTQYIVHNPDGSITVTTIESDGARPTGRTLSQLAPGLQVGKTYKFSINTTGTSKYIYMAAPVNMMWSNGTSKTITQDMLNSTVYLYASGTSTSATIYDIQITEENPEMPFETLVPAGYTPVEWIESTGAQWIDLPFGFNATDEIETKFSIDTSQSSDKYIISPSTWNTGNNRFGLGVHSGGRYTMAFGDRSTGMTVLSPGIVNNGALHVWEYKGRVCRVADLGPMRDFSDIMFGSETANLKLFYGYNSNTKGKIVYYRHKKNNALVVNLIPARRNSDNVLGMYDTVNNVFYTNAATSGDDFTAGPDINNIIYVPQGQN